MTKRLPAPKLPRWLDQMVPFERYAVEIENQRIHVMETGRGRPVVCLHGNPTWGFLYRKVAQELRSEFRVIMPDLVGLGYSTRPTRTEAHTVENHARWIGKLVDALEIEDWILVVQDWGGAIGLLAAARAEHKPAGIVLLNTVVGPPKPDFEPAAFHKLAQTPLVSDVLFRVFGLVQHGMSLFQNDRRSISGKVARAYRHPLRRLTDNAAPLAMARMAPDSWKHPSIEPLQRSQAFIESFDGPIAGVWGANDPLLGRVVNHLERLLPDARFVHTNAGHFLQEEVPAPIADAVRYVARRLD